MYETRDWRRDPEAAGDVSRDGSMLVGSRRVQHAHQADGKHREDLAPVPLQHGGLPPMMFCPVAQEARCGHGDDW